MGVKIVVQKCTTDGCESVPQGGEKVYHTIIVKLINTYEKRYAYGLHYDESTFLEGSKEVMSNGGFLRVFLLVRTDTPPYPP